MAHGLAHQHFRSNEEVKKWIDSWIASKDTSFLLTKVKQEQQRIVPLPLIFSVRFSRLYFSDSLD